MCAADVAGVRLVACDLDGTLLDRDGIVAPGVPEALDDLAAAGVAFVVCTGRPHAAALRLLTSAGVWPVILASYHGAVIVDLRTGARLRQLTMPGRLSALFTDVATAFRLDFTTYVGDDVACAPRPSDEPTRFIFSGPAEAVTAALPAVRRVGGDLVRVDLVRVDRPATGRLDVRHPLATKDRALALVTEVLGVSPCSAVAVGDDRSDIDMLRLAGLGVVVGDEQSPIRAAGDVVVPRAQLGDYLRRLAATRG